VLDNAVDWFVQRQQQYVPLSLTNGQYQSEVFPGLWLDPDALLRSDLMRVIQMVQAGCTSPEHAGFLSAHPPRP
jgi:hypothetical protein